MEISWNTSFFKSKEIKAFLSSVLLTATEYLHVYGARRIGRLAKIDSSNSVH